MRPQNFSTSLDVKSASLVDGTQLSKGLELIGHATELLQPQVQQDPSVGLHLSTLLIELGKFQLLLDTDGKPREATRGMTQHARAWVDKALVASLRSGHGTCVECEVAFRQMEEVLRREGSMDTGGSHTTVTGPNVDTRLESPQIDYSGFRVTPGWTPDVGISADFMTSVARATSHSCIMKNLIHLSLYLTPVLSVQAWNLGDVKPGEFVRHYHKERRPVRVLLAGEGSGGKIDWAAYVSCQIHDVRLDRPHLAY